MRNCRLKEKLPFCVLFCFCCIKMYMANMFILLIHVMQIKQYSNKQQAYLTTPWTTGMVWSKAVFFSFM